MEDEFDPLKSLIVAVAYKAKEADVLVLKKDLHILNDEFKHASVM